MAGRVFLRGDTHGDFDFLPYFCEENETDKHDVLIILGDAGILYYGDKSMRERELKQYISDQPITIVCIRGNHEQRPEKYNENMYSVWIHNENYAGEFMYESGFPDILYTKDGFTYHFGDKNCLAIGGAYSVDKWYRLQVGYKWFEDEELTPEEMEQILVTSSGKEYDYIFTHTCPYEWMPTDLFLPWVDQNTVSNEMERFLTKLKDDCLWHHWYFGHFHADRDDVCGDGKVTMLYNKTVQIV